MTVKTMLMYGCFSSLVHVHVIDKPTTLLYFFMLKCDHARRSHLAFDQTHKRVNVVAEIQEQPPSDSSTTYDVIAERRDLSAFVTKI